MEMSGAVIQGSLLYRMKFLSFVYFSFGDSQSELQTKLFHFVGGSAFLPPFPPNFQEIIDPFLF